MLTRIFRPKKRFLILVGPQGSGNHLFAKRFATDPRDVGWKMEDDEWQSHQREPFLAYWHDPSALTKGIFSAYGFTSISVPYRDASRETLPHERKFSVPPVLVFYDRTRALGVNSTICVIGRDPNILQFQQTRRRGQSTTDTFLSVLETIAHLDLYYLSHENLLLYRRQYLRQVAKDLDFPIDTHYPGLDTILKDQNRKYIHSIPRRNEDPETFDKLYPDAYDKKDRRSGKNEQ